LAFFGANPSRGDDFMNAGAQRVSVWLAHWDTETEMGDRLERMAETLMRERCLSLAPGATSSMAVNRTCFLFSPTRGEYPVVARCQILDAP